MAALKFYVAVFFNNGVYQAYSPDLNTIFNTGEDYETSLQFDAQQSLTDKVKNRQDLFHNAHMGHMVVLLRMKKYAATHRIPIENILDVKPVVIYT